MPVRMLGLRWVALGLAGSLAICVASADLLRARPITWWFDPHVPGATPLLYAGILALCAAWLGVGRRLRSCPVRPQAVVALGAVWCAPLLFAPALFSRDLYSYLADGAILHHGLDPYVHAPAVLSSLGEPHLLNAVSPFWRHTIAPYGPAFVGLAALVAARVGSNLVLGILLLRVLELGGVLLLAVFVPRLARALGADPARATWLAVISPLVLVSLIAGGHNDALMAGLLVAGVTLALERRPLLGIALCALAATIKLPAAAGVVFIAAAWARAEPERAGRIGVCSVLVAGAVLLLVSAATGIGLDWIGGTLAAPAKVRIALTPSTAIGYSIASVLHDLGVSTPARAIESTIGMALLAATAAWAIWLCSRVRYETLAWYLGLLLLVSVLSGPAPWPWYGIWGLALIAGCARTLEWLWLPLTVAASTFVIRADGQVLLHRQVAPFVLGAYAIVAVLALAAARRRRWTPPFSRAAEFAR
jgi:hypothetical protein